MKKLFILCLVVAGCGIKADPEPPRAPEIDIRRIGEKVYVKSLSGNIRVEGFRKEDIYWTMEREEAFCFLVERIGGKTKRFCVDGATKRVPSLDLLEEEHVVRVIPSGFESYRLYPYREDFMELEKGKDFAGAFSLEKNYWERCYFLTGVVGAKTESSPLKFCIKPKPPPAVEDVKSLEIREGEEKLYLMWSYEGEYGEFVLYADGRKLGRTKGFTFEVPKPEKETVFTLKVINPLGFESRGVEFVYNPIKSSTEQRPLPVVEEVKSFEIRVGEKKLYLVWSYEGEYGEFVLYVDGRELGRTRGFAFEVPKPERETVFTLKVISPSGFESKGVELVYSP